MSVTRRGRTLAAGALGLALGMGAAACDPEPHGAPDGEPSEAEGPFESDEDGDADTRGSVDAGVGDREVGSRGLRASVAAEAGDRALQDAVAAGSPDADAADVFVLRRPPPREIVAPGAPPLPRRGARTALAWQFDAPIFRRAGAARRPLGLVRRDTRLAVEAAVEAEGCAMGWYSLVGGGFVCEGEGFTVAVDPAPLSEELRIVPPDAARALPYRYGKLRTPAPLYWRLPTADELATDASEPVRERARGAWFVAMDRREMVGDEALHRTVRGFYVRERDFEEKPAATLQGELLLGDDALPLAFVHTRDAALVDPDTGAHLGTAERFARFTVAEVRERGDGSAWVVATDGFAARGEDVRVARARARPAEVAEGEPWIHIDLDQQTLVAYEGDRPVLATLVSSGKPGFEPPLGLFRVHKKYATVTMSGPDPDAGTYTVEEVPWTMYYWGSFALHGAYWHDEFGKVRSHGCTNLPPVDAHWLFHWSPPALEPGWHAVVGIKGPWVWFTQGTSDREPASGSP